MMLSIGERLDSIFFFFLTKQRFKASLKQYFHSNHAAEGQHEQVVEGNKPHRS